MIVLMVMTDGRPYIETAIGSFHNLEGPITRRIIHDDSADPKYRAYLRATFPDYEVYSTPSRQGFGGAYQSAWRLLTQAVQPYVFSTEDDFIIERPVNLHDMVAVLDANPHLQQMALRRQPWNTEEEQAGGVIEQHPEEYEEQYDGLDHWLEHRMFWTTNPSLYRRSLVYQGWPTESESEGRFSARLFANPELKSGYWGARESEPQVTHIGVQRIGVGY